MSSKDDILSDKDLKSRRKKARKRMGLLKAVRLRFEIRFLRVLDCIKALVLALYSLVLGPLMLLKVPMTVGRYLAYAKILLRVGLLSKSMQIAIDWRLGQFAQAAVQLEEVMQRLEKYVARQPGKVNSLCHVMARLYTMLIRSYLHAGMIDQAMCVVLRAKNTLKGEYLHELIGLDARSAQIIRAGLSAGRFLENGGMTTMVIRADQEPQLSKERFPGYQDTPSSSSDANKKTVECDENSDTGKLIPFPMPDPHHD